MILKIKHVSMKNFLSIGNAPVEFDVKSGLHYVTGRDKTTGLRNGVGKTAVFIESILFAFYGKTYRKVNLADIVNSKNKKDCLVKVHFSVDNHEYIIERGINPSVLKIYDITRQNEIELSHKRETQELIDDIIKVDFQACKNMMLMSINGHQHFMSMKKAEKRAFIEHILNIDILGKIFDTATQEYNKTKSTTDAKIRQFEMSTSFLNKMIENNNKIDDEIAMFHAKQQQEIEDIKVKISAKQEELSRVECNKDVIVAHEKEIESVEEKIKSLSELQGKTNGLIFANDKDIKKINKDLEFMTKTKVCFVCNSELTDDHKQREIGKLHTQKTTKELDNETHNATLQKITSLMSHLRQKQITLKSEIKLELEKINRQTQLLTAITMLEKQLDDKQNETCRFVKMNTEEAQQEHNKLSIEMTELSEKLQYDTLIKTIFSDGGIKQYIIKKILPTLNNKMKYYLELMGTNFWVVFDDLFDEKICSISRESLPYENFSAGEQKRIDLALLLSFIDIARMQGKATPNMLGLDEIADSSLDQDGLENFLTIMKEKVVNEDIAAFVISHRKDHNSDLFDSIFMLEKSDSFTEIKEIYS